MHPLAQDVSVKIRPASFHARFANRLNGLALAVAPGSVLLVASRLVPNPSGVETHTQLGLLPCAFMGATGQPCPTCGMTTAFAHAAHGEILASIAVQPFGGLLAIAFACLVLIGAWAAISDMPLGPILRPLSRVSTLVTLLALLLGAWVYKLLVVRYGAL